MYLRSLMFACLCLLTSGLLAVAEQMSSSLSTHTSAVRSNAPSQSTSSIKPSSVTSPSPSLFSSSSSSSSSSSPKAAANASVAASPTAVPSSSSYFSSSSSSYSSSTTLKETSPSFSSSASSTSPSPPPQSVSASAAPSQSTSSPSSVAFPATTTTITTTTTTTPMADPTYTSMVAAVVSGFCLLAVLIMFLAIMALVYRYLGKEETSTVNMMKKPKKSVDAFYTGQEPQSAQQLVSSTSITSFGSSSSDPRLENHLTTGVHYNRGFDVDHHPSGTGAVPNGHDEGFRPIQIIAADVNPRASSSRV